AQFLLRSPRSGTASFDDVPPASPAANSSASGDALGTPAEAPPPSEAFNPNPDRTASPPSVGAPIATPASCLLVGEPGMRVEELQLAGVVRIREHRQHLAPEHPAASPS